MPPLSQQYVTTFSTLVMRPSGFKMKLILFRLQALILIFFCQAVSAENLYLCEVVQNVNVHKRGVEQGYESFPKKITVRLPDTPGKPVDLGKIWSEKKGYEFILEDGTGYTSPAVANALNFASGPDDEKFQPGLLGWRPGHWIARARYGGDHMQYFEGTLQISLVHLLFSQVVIAECESFD